MAKRNLPPKRAEALAKAHSVATREARGKSFVLRPEGKTLVWFSRSDKFAGKPPDLEFSESLTDERVFALLSERRG